MDTKHLREDEQQIDDRCERATQGPWTLTKPPKTEDGWATGVTVAATYGRQAIYATPHGGQFPANDALFIAEARIDVPLLVSRLCECRKQVEELQRSQRTFAAEQLEEVSEAFESSTHGAMESPDYDALFTLRQVVRRLETRAAELKDKE